MQDNVTATEYRRWLMRIDTCVNKKCGYFEYKLCHQIWRHNYVIGHNEYL